MRFTLTQFKNILPHYRDTPERRYFKITVLLLAGFLIISVVVALTVFFLALRSPEEVLVPHVVSTSERRSDLITAMVTLQEKGLLAKIQLKHSSTHAKGTIIDQRPRAGAVVKAGRRILLTVSEGPVISSVGNYVGKTLSALKIELQELFAGDTEALIRIREPVMYIYYDTEPQIILEQNPEPGTDIREGKVVYLELVVSKGPRGEQFEVPNLADRFFDEVMDELAEKDVPFTFRIREAETGERTGVIVGQEPEAGEKVPQGTILELTMTEPTRIPAGYKFGFLDADIAKYPILVDIELVEVIGRQRRILLQMKHPGGPLTLPYLIREEGDVELYINNILWRGTGF